LRWPFVLGCPEAPPQLERGSTSLPYLRSRQSGPRRRTTVADPPAVTTDDHRLERRSRVSIRDRKSTRLNSSHVKISYAVFCLKKKTQSQTSTSPAVVSATGAWK